MTRRPPVTGRRGMGAHLQPFTTTIFNEMSLLAARTGSINLGQGFPDTDGPAEVAEAAVSAIRAGHNQYPPGPGLPALRQAVAEHQRRCYGLEHDPDTDVVTARELYGNDSAASVDHRNVELMTVAKVAVEALIEKRTGIDDLYVTMDTGDLGGPSGGLAFALALLDVLTPGELTNGRRVAATGTIAPDGAVGPVSGIPQKTLAVRRAGVEVFLVPRADYDEVVALAGDMRVVPVDTFDDAVSALQAG